MSAILRSLLFILISALAIGLFLSAFAFAFRQLNLLPPTHLTIAAGAPGSAYHETAEAYQKVLARDDIALEILETGGSVENARRLGEDADLALLQGGVPVASGAEGIASIYVEPIWIFARADIEIDPDPNLWQGLRIAAGGPGSGVRLVADRLSRITGAASLARENTVEAGGAEAAEMLLDGRLDIALFVAPATAPYLQSLFQSDAVRFISLAHSEAVTLKLNGARPVAMPSGILDYQRPFPVARVDLIALVTRVAASEELHPALVNRIVHAITEVHGGDRIIPADRQYPSANDHGLDSNAYAKQLLESGFSPLEQFLPYWIVAQFNRILLLLLPAIFLLLPLLRLLPAVYQWIFRGRVYRHYTRIHEIDELVSRDGEAISADQRAALREELDHIEQRLRRANLPNVYRKQAYTLLHHIDYVRRRIADTAGDP